ncbi:Coilin [Larimichthys crocea]|uniref:Uncharacterized protein n=1 Tax=Larimichthys crocea TaxID=215358 RepID=A0ACD3R8Z5_LARCR|nr:Coilin [Larimichthys crocea]
MARGIRRLGEAAAVAEDNPGMMTLERREGVKVEGAAGGTIGNFKFSYNGAMEPSYQTDSLSNVSLVVQNGAESAPKQDYSSMPLLAAPPQVGQRIAFKLLELTENYTPEVSEYKVSESTSDMSAVIIGLKLLGE